MPRALVAGDLESLLTIADTVIALPTMAIMYAPSATSISRSLAGAGEIDMLERFARQLEALPGTGSVAIGPAVARGLLARLAGRGAEAAALLEGAEQQVRLLGRHYEAACLALEVASSLDDAGDERGAAEALARANERLAPLGCVNAY